jgi:hypothetical protein
VERRSIRQSSDRPQVLLLRKHMVYEVLGRVTVADIRSQQLAAPECGCGSQFCL